MKTLVAVLLGLSFATPSFAAVVRFTWGSADAVVTNQDWAGPATYDQTLSLTGHSGSVSHVTLTILYGRPAYGADFAWHALYNGPTFQELAAPLADCEGGPGFSVTAGAVGAAPIPGASVSASILWYEGLTDFTTHGIMKVEIDITPPLIADPGTRYGLATLHYHHANSAPGVSPTACDNADATFCFAALGATGLGTAPLLEPDLLSWQNAGGSVNCYRGATPARVSTWGSVKQIYR